MIDKFELSALIGRLAEARVVAVGDLMLDRFVEGVVDRISPEAPIPVFSMRRESSMLGGVGNVLRNLSALGAESELIAVIGDDAAGDEVANVADRWPGSRSLANTSRSSTPPTQPSQGSLPKPLIPQRYPPSETP